MKIIWKGSISFGLVSIPIRLYGANQEHAIGFTLLCKKCHTPITYERRCEHCDKEIAWADVVKGLKMPDGSYFILAQEKLKELKPKTTDTLTIVEFVPADQIEQVYLKNHFYLAPDKAGQKAYFLFKKALEQTKKVAVGVFIMRDKQHLCIITPQGDMMLLTTLYYAYEIRDSAEIDMGTAKVDAQELKLALQLIDQLSVKKFNLGQFKDTFAQNLLAAIKKGKRGKRLSKKEAAQPKTKKKETTLLTRLRSSLRAPSATSATVAYARGKK
jgi:DNA end-binding protein Ku